MDSERFDAWTRRSVGIGIGAAIAGVLGLIDLEDGAARKNKNKNKNKKK